MTEELIFFSTRLSRRVKTGILISVDTALYIAAFYLASAAGAETYRIIFDTNLALIVFSTLPLAIAFFLSVKFYSSVVRYISLHSLKYVAMAGVMSAVAAIFVANLIGFHLSASAALLFVLLYFLLVSTSRFAFSAAYLALFEDARQPVAIYGAGQAGKQLLQSLSNSREYKVRLLIDDDPRLQGSRIGAVSIMGFDASVRHFEKHGIKMVLVAMPSVAPKRIGEILKQFGSMNMKVKRVPPLDILGDRKAEIRSLQNITVEDLLGREPVPPVEALMSPNLIGKSVLVSGAGGSIGSEICRNVIKRNPRRLILLDVSEFALYKIHGELKAQADDTVELVVAICSVTDEFRLQQIFSGFEVDTVYHCAALKHVPLVELNVAEGIKTNVFGTLSMVRSASAASVKSFTLISTDKAVRPTNVMGATKRVAELICQTQNTDESETVFSIVRFGNVLNSSGSVIPKFVSQINSGGPITLTHPDMERYFMTIEEAAQLVIQASSIAVNGEVFVLDMGKPIKIFDLAQHMIRLQGYQVGNADTHETGIGDTIKIEITAPRPGEKLFEELWINQSPTKTIHPKIMKTAEEGLSDEALAILLEALKKISKCGDLQEIEQLLAPSPIFYSPSSPLADSLWKANRRVDNKPTAL